MIVKCYSRMKCGAFTVKGVACIGINGTKVRCTLLTGEVMDVNLGTHNVYIYDGDNCEHGSIKVNVSEKYEKPPLGLRPRYIVDGERAGEIAQAIARYTQAGKPVPPHWVGELAERVSASIDPKRCRDG